MERIIAGSMGFGWWLQPTPLKNDGVKVSWDDDIPFPTEWKVIKNAMVPVTTNQGSDGIMRFPI